MDDPDYEATDINCPRDGRPVYKVFTKSHVVTGPRRGKREFSHIECESGHGFNIGEVQLPKQPAD